MRLAYRIVNVFTVDGGRMTGNPLCVFEDGSALRDAEMQALALQFNLSETAFVSASTKADARVRIFAPGYEMPFAGHPTLGTASVVASLKGLGDAVNLELNVGVVPVVRDRNQWELRAHAATSREPGADPSVIASALGLTLSDLGGSPLWVSTGTEQLIVPLATEDAVRRARTSYDALAAATADGTRPNAYVFASTGESSLLARYFFSTGKVMFEDPATGSATANLGGFLIANGAPLPLIRHIAQGEQTGRPSNLRLRIDDAGGIHVAGGVVELGRGYIET